MKLTPREEDIAKDWETGIMRDMIPLFIGGNWLTAARSAIERAKLPPEKPSWASWIIGLASNTLAFASCFYPPVSVLSVILNTDMKYHVPDAPGDTGLNIIAAREHRASMKNGALAILANEFNLMSMVMQYPKSGGDEADPKTWLVRAVSYKSDQLRNMYVAAAPDWVRTVMIPTYRQISDQQRKRGYDWQERGGIAAVDRQRFVWNNLIFPNMNANFDNRDGSIIDLNLASMQNALEQFNRQYTKWIEEGVRHMTLGKGAFSGGFRGTLNIPNAEWAKKNPLEPRITFSGIPEPEQLKLRAGKKIGSYVNLINGS